MCLEMLVAEGSGKTGRSATEAKQKWTIEGRLDRALARGYQALALLVGGGGGEAAGCWA